MKRPISIDSDGITVWVNDGICCLGRFGIMGIDVHKTFVEQVATGDPCLECTHALTTAEDWVTFQRSMERHHNVVVPDKYRPKRFQAA